MTKRDYSFFTSRQFVGICLIIFIVLIWVFYHFTFSNPSSVFNRMLSNTLSTSSYTKTINDYSNNQYSRQVASVETGAVNRVIDSEALSIPFYPQGGISILSVGTPTTDYSTYTRLATEARDSNGHLINYSPALGLWSANSAGGASSSQGYLFNSLVVDIVPIANVSSSDRQELFNYLKQNPVYQVSGAAKRENIQGRSEYVYDVMINNYYLQNYLHMFARAIGLNSYSNNLPVSGSEQAQFGVDVVSGQLASISFAGSNRTYSYSSYGANLKINVPKKFISLGDLENYIRSLSTR